MADGVQPIVHHSPLRAKGATTSPAIVQQRKAEVEERNQRLKAGHQSRFNSNRTQLAQEEQNFNRIEKQQTLLKAKLRTTTDPKERRNLEDQLRGLHFDRQRTFFTMDTLYQNNIGTVFDASQSGLTLD